MSSNDSRSHDTKDDSQETLDELISEKESYHLTEDQAELFRLIEQLNILLVEKQTLQQLKASLSYQIENAFKQSSLKISRQSISELVVHQNLAPSRKQYLGVNKRLKSLGYPLRNELDIALLTLVKQDAKNNLLLDRISRTKKIIYETEAQLHPLFLLELCQKIQDLLTLVMKDPSQSKQYDTVAEKIMLHFFDTPIEATHPSKMPTTIGGLSIVSTLTR